jgi:hypothetical protein
VRQPTFPAGDATCTPRSGPGDDLAGHFPLLDDLLAETLVIKGGIAAPPERPGHGLVWDTDEISARTERMAVTNARTGAPPG